MDFAVRYVALGDSFTEGVGDDDPGRPNGVRGWADLVAQQLARAELSFGYANLAIRGRKMGQIVAEQLEPALAMRPTLVTMYAGVNDILRPRVDIDALMMQYDDAVTRLRATGADVLLFTGFDASTSAVFGAIRGRTAIYNELLREVADRRSAILVDFWRMHEYNDWRMWGTDRMHMSTAGHINMARRVLDVLRREHALAVPELEPLAVLSRAAALRANARWTKEYVGPWVGRRLRGTSSGDALSPRWPELHTPR